MTKLVWGAAAAALVAATPALGADASQSTFGKLHDGRSVPGVTLTNGNGISATIIALGATLQSVVMPDRDGKKADVALGSDNLSEYRSEEHTSELQPLMRIPLAVFCLKKKN